MSVAGTGIGGGARRRNLGAAAAWIGAAAGAATASLATVLGTILTALFLAPEDVLLHFMPWLPWKLSVPMVGAVAALILCVPALDGRPRNRQRARVIAGALALVTVAVYTVCAALTIDTDWRAVRFVDKSAALTGSSVAAVLTLVALLVIAVAESRNTSAERWHAPVAAVAVVVAAVVTAGSLGALRNPATPTTHPVAEHDHPLHAWTAHYRIPVPKGTDIHQTGNGFVLVRGSAVEHHNSVDGSKEWSFDVADAVDATEPTRIVAIAPFYSREPSITVTRGDLAVRFRSHGGGITWRGLASGVSTKGPVDADARLLSQNAAFAVTVRSPTVLLFDEHRDRMHQAGVPAGAEAVGVTAAGDIVLRTAPGRYLLTNPFDKHQADIVPPARADGAAVELTGVAGVLPDNHHEDVPTPLVLATSDALHLWDPATRTVTRTLPSPCTVGTIAAVTAVDGAVVVRCEDSSSAELVGLPTDE